MNKVGQRPGQHLFAGIPELTQNELIRLHNLRVLKHDDTRRQRMEEALSPIQGPGGLTIFLSEQSDFVSQSLLVCPHSGKLLLKAILVSCRHGRHSILWFLEALKERGKTSLPLDVK
jgi:hypothetical protein